MIDDQAFREHLLAGMKAIAAGLVDHARALDAVAAAITRQGRQGTLKLKLEVPSAKKRRKVRART